MTVPKHEWDLNNLKIASENADIYSEVDFTEDGDGASTNLDSLLEKSAAQKFSNFEYSSDSEINDFFQPVRPPKRFRVRSASQLKQHGFLRLGSSNNVLINKSTRDLWALKKDGKGYFIEELFDDQAGPLTDTV